MKREQAVRINDHLLDACRALDQARMGIAALGKAERIKLGDWLEEVVAALEDELLQPIYDQYPDLEPPRSDREPLRYICELTWDEVQLPTSMTEKQLDEIIFSVMKPTWRKTAMAVTYVLDRCKELGLPIEGEVIGARLKVLRIPIASKASGISDHVP